MTLQAYDDDFFRDKIRVNSNTWTGDDALGGIGTPTTGPVIPANAQDMSDLNPHPTMEVHGAVQSSQIYEIFTNRDPGVKLRDLIDLMADDEVTVIQTLTATSVSVDRMRAGVLWYFKAEAIS